MPTEDQPHLSLPLLPAEKRLEWAGWLLLLGLWLVLAASYRWLPERVPTHFGAGGQADRFGARGSIWLGPLIATVVFGVLTKLGNYPHIFNYPLPITLTTAEREYRAARQLLRLLKLGVVATVALMTALEYQASFAAAPRLPGWQLPLTLLLCLGPLVWYLAGAWRRKLPEMRNRSSRL